MINNTDLEAFGYYDYEWEKERQYDMTPMDMVREYASVAGQKPDPNLYLNLIFGGNSGEQGELNEWVEEKHKEGTTDYSSAREFKEYLDTLYVMFGYGEGKGWDVIEGLRRIHQNNIGRCYQPDGTIKRREDGKIIKCPNYPKVDLSDLV